MSLKFLALIAGFAWCSVVLSIDAQEPVPNKTSGSISGRITVDGKPKAGLVVELLARDTNAPRRPVAKAITTKSGKYVLTNVASGTYDVSPSTPTLVVPNQGLAGQSGRSVTIEPGESIKGIDFDLISKGSIRGRVLDVTGEPVKGQTVELILRGADNYTRPFYSSEPGEHRTNDEGVYRITGVPPGRYIVKVGTAYGLATYGRNEKRVYYPETFHPNVDEASKATVVEVTSGREIADVDITVSRPLKLYDIVGQLIVLETGAPVANVGLEVVTTSANGKNSTHSGGGVRSDANGEFRISNAMPGHYVVAPENDRVSNTYGDPISFDIKDEDVIGLKIPMHSASTVTGIVTIEGSVDVPVADVLSKLMIYAHTSSDNMMSSTVSAPVNADGGFRIAGIRPGKVSLNSFMKPGGPALPLRLIRIERNGIEWRDAVDVRSGEDITGLRLVLGAGNSVLRGDVKIEGGPLEGISLHVLYRPTSGTPGSFYRAELDTRQHFVIKGLTPGEYELMIGPMSVEISGEGGSRIMNRMPTVKQTVTIGAGTETDVTLVMTLKPERPR